MIYNYNTATLILQSELVRSVRQQASQLIPTQALDREQVLQSIALACADLDAADPLILEHTIDTSAYLHQDSPILPGAVPSTKPGLFALYQPAHIDQDNLIEWEWAGPTDVKPLAIVSVSSMLALIRWPYAAAALTEINTTPPPGTLAACVAYTADNTIPTVYAFGAVLVVDGRTIAEGERVLIGNAIESDKAGIFVLNHTNENEYTLQRPADANTALELGGAVGAVVAVTQGSRYAGTVWQITTPGDPPGYYAVQPAAGTTYTVQRANFTRDQATAYIIPRASAYLVHQVALTIVDKTQSQHLIDWATAILARPIPAASQAISYRLQSATRYANS